MATMYRPKKDMGSWLQSFGEAKTAVNTGFLPENTPSLFLRISDNKR